MLRLLLLLAVLLLSQNLKLSEAKESLPLETCDKLAIEIASLQEELLKTLPSDRDLIDLSNATSKEVEKLKHTIFSFKEKKRTFVHSCFRNYALPFEELEKAQPQKFYFLIGETFYTKPGFMGIGRDFAFYGFTDLFFYLKKYTNLDLRFIVYPAYNYEQYNKKLQKFRKKMFFSEDLKANFCMKIGENFVIINESLAENPSITIACPSFRLEKEHSLPVRNFLLKFPDQEIVTEEMESKSVIAFLFTGKYTFQRVRNVIKYNNQFLPLVHNAHGPVLPLNLLEKPEELISWLRRELSLRGLWSEKK